MKKYIISLIVFLSFYAQADLTDFRVATWNLQ
ncbi:TPA: cytolethal distending toxin subunit B family protein, partial [Escherichia coli]|nr:cytolethal distending toxin subunit B family protein [Escherichia coli]HDV1980192.1 cytolethal distending toxin subunit B family protein [Escherichia coli]HDV2175949.1 cytolethal distending toxin subunit B family protein [Escherichia coli]